MLGGILGGKFFNKCKHSAKNIRARIGPIRSKKQATVRWLKKDVADLIAAGQRLDMQTGEIYYINWETGVRTILDPRSAGTSTYSSSYYYSDEDEVSGTRSGCDEEEVEDGYDETVDSDEDEAFGTGSSRNGCDEEEEDSTGDDGETLIAAGCNACFIYLMVPKGAPACLKCGGALIHLGDYL